jgi:hypothetical protein
MIMFSHSAENKKSESLAIRAMSGAFFVALILSALFSGIATAGEPDEFASPRQLYNDGTRKLHENKLSEAEACLQGAVASQNEVVRPFALYNLGSTRFREGAEELKKGPQPSGANSKADFANEFAGEAIRAADKALAGDDLNELVTAYMQGRGARKELKAATEAVKAALDSYNSVLAKWQRSLGDFKSARELATDNDAQTNADLVDRHIAALVDQIKIMMQSMSGLGKQRTELGKRLAALKKRMPPNSGQDMKGKGDDDDDDDGPSKQPKAGQEEPGTKSGSQMLLTPEEAAHLLDMLKLDTNRKLPLGMGDTGKRTDDRKGRDW